MFFSLLEWILIAIVIAAIFGVINLNSWRILMQDKFKKILPHLKNIIKDLKKSHDKKD